MAATGELRYAGKNQSRTKFSSFGEKNFMEQRAAARLGGSPYPEVRGATCEFHEGLLFLRGRVPSYYLKQMAQTAVLGLDGVDEIHNQLEVVEPPDGP